MTGRRCENSATATFLNEKLMVVIRKESEQRQLEAVLAAGLAVTAATVAAEFRKDRRNLVRKILIVPENKPAGDLLTDFKKNKDRFGQHLVGMGLAQRMSDACAYVLNPMESFT